MRLEWPGMQLEVTPGHCIWISKGPQAKFPVYLERLPPLSWVSFPERHQSFRP